MALINRLAQDPGFATLDNHAFAGACALWADGKITRANVIERLGLGPEDESQLDQLGATYTALPVGEKHKYYIHLHACVCLLPIGAMTKAEFGTIMGVV